MKNFWFFPEKDEEDEDENLFPIGEPEQEDLETSPLTKIDPARVEPDLLVVPVER